MKEVLDTFRVAAELGSDSLGAYVISMASNVCLTFVPTMDVKCENLRVPEQKFACLRSFGFIWFVIRFRSDIDGIIILYYMYGRQVTFLL